MFASSLSINRIQQPIKSMMDFLRLSYHVTNMQVFWIQENKWKVMKINQPSIPTVGKFRFHSSNIMTWNLVNYRIWRILYTRSFGCNHQNFIKFQHSHIYLFCCLGFQWLNEQVNFDIYWFVQRIYCSLINTFDALGHYLKRL